MVDFGRGNFRAGRYGGDFPAYADDGIRFHFYGDTIEEIESFNVESGKRISGFDKINIYPANIFVTSPETLNNAIKTFR